MWEYKVVAAPKEPARRRDAGVKELADRFAFGVEAAINALAVSGWEYQRSDVLPCEERSGLTGRSQSFQTVLVFRRPRTEPAAIAPPAAAPVEPAAPTALPPPSPDAAEPPASALSDKGDGESVDAPDKV